MKQDLYHPYILQHQKNPKHFSKSEGATHTLEAYNPLCGDQFTIFMDIKDGRVLHMSFHGYGCALSKAAASMLIDGFQDVSSKEIMASIQDFFTMLDDRHREFDDTVPITVFHRVNEYPERRVCVELVAREIAEFFKNRT